MPLPPPVAPPIAPPAIIPGSTGLESQFGNIENLVSLTSGQFTMGSLILMVSYGAHFAFIIYFVMMSRQLAPRYRIVPILSAVVMASAGLSLLREFTTWQDTYTLVNGLYQPLIDGNSFTNAFRYGNWSITVPILLAQLPIAFGLSHGYTHKKVVRMAIPALLMVWTGLIGQFGETGDFGRLNLWGVISSVFFVWLIVEVRGVITAGIANSPGELKVWPKNIWWYFLATWGLYPIAYALPQLGMDGDIVVIRQGIYTLADISSKLVYGIILSRYVLRRSAMEGYVPSAEALDTTPLGPKVASARGD